MAVNRVCGSVKKQVVLVLVACIFISCVLFLSVRYPTGGTKKGCETATPAAETCQCPDADDTRKNTMSSTRAEAVLEEEEEEEVEPKGKQEQDVPKIKELQQQVRELQEQLHQQKRREEGQLHKQLHHHLHVVREWWQGAISKRLQNLDRKQILLANETSLLSSLQRALFLSEYWNRFGQSNQLWRFIDVSPPDVTEWWQAAAMIDWYIESPVTMKCQRHQAVGNWHVCMDPPYTVRPPCLVYSFGIGFDFSFDDAMGKLGCEVHSFDPSMNLEDHRRNDNVTFHNLGISGSNDDNFTARHDMYVKEKQVWKIRTLDAIMRDLGHTNRTLDVLKIDVEGHEWAIVDDLMKKGVLTSQVRHFLLEWHLFPDWPDKNEYQRLFHVYERFKNSGFVEYFKGPHPKRLNPESFNIQGDIEFINSKFAHH